ncbi:MAG TPA: methylmalonyl Co-A mutase-associated GTPase MeaB [Thermomicrobiales bacterium]|jgi:LAO/AO transport system kinase|nr:methylmalonyl Co-A mutase-associated GTPase MeaB [Thermomicrobiales bacterium]
MSEAHARIDTLVEQIAAGDRRLLARTASAIERVEPRVDELSDALYRAGGRGHVVGITGPPGAGKSTLVDALISEWRERDQRVAVLAIDPSSPLTGGATLGDRYRMMRHHADQGVFIRSMANRGLPGGLAPTTIDLVQLLDVAGFDIILVETVGVGQSETAIAALAETTVLVQVPGTGDGLQALKAGILELGDLLVVTKGDLPGARDLRGELRAMLALDPETGKRRPPVILTSARSGTGIVETVDGIAEHRAWLAVSGTGEQRRVTQGRSAILSMVGALVARRMGPGADDGLVLRVAARELSPREAARQIVDD